MDKPWLNHYEPSVPPHVEVPDLTLQDLLPRAAKRVPERTALILTLFAAGRLFNTAISYRQLERDVARFAHSLQNLGVVPGDRVALYLPNCPQFVIAYLAVLRVGAIAVPFNPLYSAREAEYQLKDCGATVAVVLDRFFPLIQGIRENTMLRQVVVTRIREYFSPLLWTLYTLTAGRKVPRFRLSRGDLWFQDMLCEGTPRPVTVDRESTAVLLYTGGTTGVSKGVELSHRNLLVNAEQNRLWASIRDDEEISLAAVPLFHGFGLTCCLHLGLRTAATVVLVPNPADTRGLIEAIEHHRPTIFPVVPTFLISIAQHPAIERRNLRSVRVCPCAGSPLAPAVQRTFIERTGVRPVEGYGLSEAGPVTHGNPPFGDDRHGTIGLPYPDTEARVVDFETGTHDMPFEGEWTRPGEIVVRGPQVMKGYWNRPEESAQQLRDGWLHTGDIGQMSRDGYFRIIDRLKDMIIRSGMNIYPADVEAVLHEHPKVLEALVIGVPDATRGELVKAFVVPRDGTELDEEEILAFCRQNMAKYKVPSAVEIRSGLRHSAVGKPLRRALREELNLVTA